jgi:hypothetical protein
LTSSAGTKPRLMPTPLAHRGSEPCHGDESRTVRSRAPAPPPPSCSPTVRRRPLERILRSDYANSGTRARRNRGRLEHSAHPRDLPSRLASAYVERRSHPPRVTRSEAEDGGWPAGVQSAVRLSDLADAEAPQSRSP